ncbi:MAG TPA: hypothetical protein VH592_12695 [Gemmataceae bacterium]
MTATTTMGTHTNGQTRKTLASQIDRLDGILDGLDAALAGAVQEAVEQAVKQAVQAVLAEVLTNRQLQEQLQRTARTAEPAGESECKRSLPYRLWQATTEGVRRTVQMLKKRGRGLGVALVAAGAMMTGIVYAVRKKCILIASSVYRHGKCLALRAISTLTSFLPSFAFGS